MLFKRSFSFIDVKRGKNVPNIAIFSKNGPELSQTVITASKKGVKNLQFWNLVKRSFLSLYKSLDAECLSRIANGFSRAEVYDPVIWDSIVARTYELTDKLNDKDIALLCNAMCKVKNIDNKVFPFLLDQLKSCESAIRCKYGSIIIYSFGKAGFRDHRSIRDILRSLELSMSEMSIACIANLVNGMYNLGHTDHRTMSVIKDRTIFLLMANEANITKKDETLKKNHDIAMKDIVTIHQGFSGLKFFKRELFDALFSYMISNNAELKPIDMVIIANSMYKSKRHNTDLIRIMSNYILKHTNKFTIDMIAKYINGIWFHNSQDNGFISSVYSLLSKGVFQGELLTKNSIVFLNVYSKSGIKDKSSLSLIYDVLRNGIDKLSSSDLTNIIYYTCLIKVKETPLQLFVEKFLGIMDKDNFVNNVRHLSKIFYSLNKVEHVNESDIKLILDYLVKAPMHAFQPTGVSNILFALEETQNSEAKYKLIEKLSEYIIQNIGKFSSQLLASSLNSMVGCGTISEGLYKRFCQYIVEGKKSNDWKNTSKFLKFLNVLPSLSNSKELEALAICAFRAVVTDLARQVELYDEKPRVQEEVMKTDEAVSLFCSKVVNDEDLALVNEIRSMIKALIMCADPQHQ